MRPRLLLTGAILAVSVVGGARAVPWVLARVDSREAFVRRAIVNLGACRTPEEVRALAPDAAAELTVWEFGEGSWIAALSHSSHSRGGYWDATVTRDSRGELYRTDVHFCAGVEFEVGAADEYPSLAAFYAALRSRVNASGGRLLRCERTAR
jgi:hypothetical protein